MNLLPTLASSNAVGHVVDAPLVKMGHAPSALSPDGTYWVISQVTVMLVLGALVTMLLVIPAARRIATGRDRRSIDDFRAQGTLANLIETVCVYLRDQVFKPVLQEHTDRFTPLLWTFFWFILVCNLLGLIPLRDITGLMGLNHRHGIGGTATQSIWVTATLSLMAFVFYNVTAIVKNPLGYAKHMTGGAPFFMWPIMVPVEILGTFIKPFALAIRLFANMTGGHLVIAVFLGFVPGLIKALGPTGYGVALVPLAGAIAINMLEVLVAFIQAYIFTFLTCLFLGQLIVHEHEEGHEEHGHESGPGHAHAEAKPAH